MEDQEDCRLDTEKKKKSIYACVYLLKYIGGKTQWGTKRTADWTQKKKN